MSDRVSGPGQEVLVEGVWGWMRQNMDATSITRQAGGHLAGLFQGKHSPPLPYDPTKSAQI